MSYLRLKVDKDLVLPSGSCFRARAEQLLAHIVPIYTNLTMSLVSSPSIEDESDAPPRLQRQPSQQRQVLKAFLQADQPSVSEPSIRKDRLQNESPSSRIPLRKIPAKQMSTMFYKASLDETAIKRGIRPTLIIGILYFTNPLDASGIRALLRERLVLEFPRFRSVGVKGDQGIILFEELDIANIDMNYHVQVVDAKGWDQEDIDDLLTEQYKQNKDIDKPLWVFYIFEQS